MSNSGKQVWFITGASTGFGKELARIVVEQGHIAVATFRKDDQIAQFMQSGSDDRLGVRVDVTRQDEVQAGVQAAIDRFGRIDVLVNNAGYGSLGGFEEIPEEEYRRQFEVNVFGVISLTRAVLPHMRKQRSGHILNVTSIGGLTGFASASYYNGTKFALEGIGEAVAREVAPLGIHVTNIEPGPFRTDWAGRSANYVPNTIEDYRESVGAVLDSIHENSGKQVGDPVRAAQAMFDIVQQDDPPLHLPLGGPAYRSARRKMQRMLDEFDKFEHIGQPTDYTEEELSKMDRYLNYPPTMSAPDIPTIPLHHGKHIPLLGLGSYKASDGPEVEQALQVAFAQGYRLIDTASMYGNEAGVGRAIRESGLPREDIFLTTKVWNSDQGYDKTLQAFDTSLDLLQLDYVDLYLIHWPVRGKFKDTWTALESIYHSGRAKAIGVSNFQVHHLEDLLSGAEVVPMVNQVELHPFLQQPELRAFCRSHDMVVEAWRPILQGQVNDVPLLSDLGEKYAKSGVQVTLRWMLQLGVVSIPKSTNPARIAQNADILDFALTPAEMESIATLDEGRRIGPDPDHFDF